MLKRREFGKAVVAGGVMAVLPAPVVEAQKSPAPNKRNTLMHVGGDYHSVAGGRGAGMTERANLEYNLRSVEKPDVRWSTWARTAAGNPDELHKMKDNCDRAGVDLEAIRMDSAYITLRKGPEA